RTRPQPFTDEDRTVLIAAQRGAMFHTFIGLGLADRHLHDLVAKVHPAGPSIIDRYLVDRRARRS
ncbi:MAG: hypothetical protein AAFN30_03815, partial [Actinomycetota bacterium]